MTRFVTAEDVKFLFEKEIREITKKVKGLVSKLNKPGYGNYLSRVLDCKSDLRLDIETEFIHWLKSHNHRVDGTNGNWSVGNFGSVWCDKIFAGKNVRIALHVRGYCDSSFFQNRHADKLFFMMLTVDEDDDQTDVDKTPDVFAGENINIKVIIKGVEENIKRARETEADENYQELLLSEENEKVVKSSAIKCYVIPEEVRKILPTIPERPKTYTDGAGIIHKPSVSKINAYNEKWGQYLKYQRMADKEKKKSSKKKKLYL